MLRMRLGGPVEFVDPPLNENGRDSGMDKGFVEGLQEAFRAPEVKTVDGREVLVLPNDWKADRPKKPEPQPLGFAALGGLRDYVKENRDELPLARLSFHVDDVNAVGLIGPLLPEGEEYRRFFYAIAKAPLIGFQFGRFYNAEEFGIALATQFVPTDRLSDLRTLVASISESSVREVVDDGVAQEVSTRSGVMLSNKKLPNPISLAPYRTFREVKQPESAFLLRARSGDDGDKPSLALFEADGGVWRLAAVESIAAWLRTEVPGGVPVLA